MRVLFVGDVVGRPGRDAAMHLLPRLRTELRIDVVVLNAENAAAGRGLTPDIAAHLLQRGVDLITGGNHIWHFREIEDYLDRESRIIRPANYPEAPGRGSHIVRLADGRTLGVIQIEGRIFMKPLACPFLAIERELQVMGRTTGVLVDLHCEATSEKQALSWYFDGRISAAIGTHTHVQTADERILPKGTAYLTDAGMTGPHDSVIGMDVQLSIQRLRTQRGSEHRVAKNNVKLCGAIVEIDDSTGKALAIERLQRPYAP
jgi:metallophosphoesterase (TIGR00282 family)